MKHEVISVHIRVPLNKKQWAILDDKELDYDDVQAALKPAFDIEWSGHEEEQRDCEKEY